MDSSVKSDQYWEQFSVLPSDLEHLVNVLLEEERPKTLEELTRKLIAYRHQQLVDLAKESFSAGRIYRPRESYEVGEDILFPHLANRVGEVVDARPGHNPQYEAFEVVTVRMENGDERQFATELDAGHPLDEATYLPSEDVEPEELYRRHGARVQGLLLEALEEDHHFLSVAGQWFVRDLLMEVSPMQLNIAEALLDMADGGPLPTEAFLEELELPEEIPESLQLFSLEHALLRDQRFDEVGPAGKALWYLQRMEPQQVQETPSHLRYVPIPHNRGLLNDTMFSLEQHVEDEWSAVPFVGEVGPEETVTVSLIYPHWRSGTLPLNDKLAQLFPTARITDRVRFAFVDDESGQEFPGWVVRSQRYVYGLEDWYRENQAMTGSFIDLRRGEEPGTIVVGTRPFRSKRGEWLRTVTAEEETFSFEVTRYPVYCEFNELVAIGVPDPDAVDALAEELRRVSLETLVERVFRELAVLSLQRAVHAATLYSVLNLFRRVPPGPMQAVLAADQKYVSLGDNYWSYRGEE